MAAPEQSAEMMSAYLDRELDPEEAARFEAYLSASPEAEREMFELQTMLAAVSQLGAVQAPEDFYDKLDRKLRRRRLLSPDGLASGLVSVPFQVLSIVVILAVAVSYMMLQLDDAARVDRDPPEETPEETEATGEQPPTHRIHPEARPGPEPG